MDTQHKISRMNTVCNGYYPGTHNTLITLANGYGNDDHLLIPLMEKLQEKFPYAAFHTNDQYLSVTDQLNLGIRFIEIDMHWLRQELTVAHCGGIHIPKLDEFIAVVNDYLEQYGVQIKWDSESIGCQPSLSGIPATDQRPLSDALEEIATWLNSHPDEFLILYFDNEPDDGDWGTATAMVELVQQYFPGKVYTPSDLSTVDGGVWPTGQEIVDRGLNILAASRADYGEDMYEIFFYFGDVCGWTELGLDTFTPYPNCYFDGLLPNNNQLIRMGSSEIQYGILNSGGQLGPNTGLLNETTIPGLVVCDLNILSPDNLTPERATSMIWTWSETTYSDGTTPSGSLLNSTDTRWYHIFDSREFPVACSNTSSTDFDWIISDVSVPFTLASTACNDPYTFFLPLNPLDNVKLADLAGSQGVEGVWINI